MVTVYGLKNCDTCRKAVKWLAHEGIAHDFHDVRADGIDARALARWADAAGWEALLNRRGTTWRKLSDADKDGVDRDTALALMQTHPALIKRPVIDSRAGITVGFTDDTMATLAGAALR